MNLSIKFRPIFWPTLFTIISLLILISLGTWQVYRLIWKNSLISNYLYKFNNEIIKYDKSFLFNDEFEYRRINIKGRFINEKEILIIGKTFEGNVGFHLITPFITKEEKLLLINRGWISEKLKLRSSRSFSLIEEDIVIDGIIRRPQKKGYFVPENDPIGNFWFTIKPYQIEKALKLESFDLEKKFYVDVIRDKGKLKLPIGVSGSPNFRNQHLTYAFTWYSLAITLIIVYFAFHFKEKRLIIKRN